MPELPEVETMRRGVQPAVGATIVDVVRPRNRLQPIAIEPDWNLFRKRLRGQSIDAVQRRGKRILLELSDSSLVIIEPRMTGLVLIGDPPGNEHIRLRLLLDFPHNHPQHDRPPCEELLFWDRRGLGTIRWIASGQLDQVLGPDRLGPDALAIDLETLQQALGHSQRAIKVALLDQKAVAGIGNLYASEILHVAGIDPRQACHRLSRAQWIRLLAATRLVLEEAIRHEGSTLSDGTYRNALNNPGSYQNHHRVYDRAGLPCPRCGLETIARIVQAQRSTFFCKSCQRRRGIHPSVNVEILAHPSQAG